MEILSPASNLEHIKVAIDGKANAVYGGLKKWNARNKAINFSISEYNYLIDELHKYGIKFFLTLNILMLDEEIEEVVNLLKNNKLPDAFIVTDMGLIETLKKEFPSVPLHFSTQFGAHNIDDVNYIKSLGGERAILSRELTLEEINKIKSNTDIELECFIWGSQCLSFSGLCFFGTLINGGGGNRGKCIITCRDIYSIDNEKGHYLYVPDMDCINLISKLDGVDCLKLEGRRRNPNEIKTLLHHITNNIPSKENTGYMFGTNIVQNNLYEKINSRVKPIMKASLLDGINCDDICVRYEKNKPIEFSDNYENPDVLYLYTEIKKKYDINKKNISLDLNLDEYNHLTEVLYVNHRGDGHTFVSMENDFIEFNIHDFVKYIENSNSKINIYKIKYKRKNNAPIFIDNKLYSEIVDYLLKDCHNLENKIINNELILKQIYLETNDLKIVDEFVNDKFIKIIYDISTIENLKNIDHILNKYNNSIIYKLPLFNWNSDDLMPYLNKFNNKEIMFTRFTQIYLSKDIKFKKKYVDYTIYVWNKKTLNYLIKNDISVFTASPELSYDTNKKILGDLPMQVILCGKLPLVYTRNCFNHLFGCQSCVNNQCKNKRITNEDKKLDFDILCNSNYRYVLNSNPILNDYSKVELTNNTYFRYVTLGQNIDIIKETIEILKKQNYFNELKQKEYWKYSYECNVLEGRE